MNEAGGFWNILLAGALALAGKIVIILLVLAGASLVAGWVRRAIRRSFERVKGDTTAARFASSAASWLVWVLAGLACISVFGIETTTFAAVLGAAGLAIGLAFQGSLSNLAAGFMLLIFRPFTAGEVINVNGTTAKVDAIDLFSTTLDTFDNRRIIMPNSSVFGSTIENISFHDTRRVDVNVGVDYDADIDQTRAALLAAVGDVANIHADPAPVAVCVELGASSVDWSVRVWTDAPEFWTVKENLTVAIKSRLDAAGLNIPFPRMDISMVKDNAGA